MIKSSHFHYNAIYLLQGYNYHTMPNPSSVNEKIAYVATWQLMMNANRILPRIKYNRIFIMTDDSVIGTCN